MVRFRNVFLATFALLTCVLPAIKGQGPAQGQGQGQDGGEGQGRGRRLESWRERPEGGRSDLQEERVACRAGLNLTDAAGFITFRGVSLSDYSINHSLLCIWRLPATFLERISLKFEAFNVGVKETKDFCAYSQVCIQEGARRMDFCGSQPPTTAFVSRPGNSVVVEYRFRITDKQLRTHFTLKYHRTRYRSFAMSRRISRFHTMPMENIQSCVGKYKITLTDSTPSTTIQVKGYEYSNNCDQIWTVLAPNHKVIQVQASGFIEYEAMCRFDQLSMSSTYSDCPAGIIRRQVQGACSRFGCLCGEIDPTFTHQSLCNTLTIRFQSDLSITEQGFLLNLTLVDKEKYPKADSVKQCIQDDVVCGRMHSISARVTGGAEALPHQFPWEAMLEYNNVLICGGSLISNRWVLTAAHCVINVLGPSLLRVRLGKHFRDVLEPQEQVSGVKEIIVHCQYNRKTFDNDIALLKLSEDIEFSNTVQPICLPSDRDVPVLAMCHIAGWGYTQEGDRNTTSNALRYGEVVTQSNGQCQSAMAAHSSNITDNMLCAISQRDGSRDDGCNGDSGGPLMLKVNPVDQSVQYGIVSWGIGCGRPGLPGVYTRVHKYIDWILSVTEGCIYIHDPEIYMSRRGP